MVNNSPQKQVQTILLKLIQLCSQGVDIKKFVKIGRPGYRVTKQRDADNGQQSLLFEVVHWDLSWTFFITEVWLIFVPSKSTKCWQYISRGVYFSIIQKKYSTLIDNCWLVHQCSQYHDHMAYQTRYRDMQHRSIILRLLRESSPVTALCLPMSKRFFLRHS